MSRMLRTSGTVVIVGGLLLGTVLFTSAATARTNTAAQTIHLSVQFHDSPPLAIVGPFPTVGDEVVIHDLLFKGDKQVGHNGGVCVLSDAATPEIACAVTYSFADGQIATQFLTTPPPQKVVAITGGTGIYRNVRGDGTLVENPDQTGEITFHLIGVDDAADGE